MNQSITKDYTAQNNIDLYCFGIEKFHTIQQQDYELKRFHRIMLVKSSFFNKKVGNIFDRYWTIKKSHGVL